MKFDAIVLGSGIGGMAAGLLARAAGLKVLVLKRRWELGEGWPARALFD